MRVALVHDWIIAYGGAEKVLLEMLEMFPRADVFTLLYFPDPQLKARLSSVNISTSFLQRIPLARKKYRSFLPLMPIAIEQFDFSSYDLVISSSHAVAKGILTTGEQLHCSYVHSPMRYAWDLQNSYLKSAGLSSGLKGALASYLLHKMRIWDYRTANGVDVWIANSKFIARRIKKVYGKTAAVCYPPVDIDRFACHQNAHSSSEECFLVASRLVQYKRVDLIVETFTQLPDKKLVVVGDGPELERLKALSTPNITFTGWLPDREVVQRMRDARAFVFAAEEDFGIVLVEAQAAGVPVIAYGRGGATESVIDGTTGILYPEQHVESLLAAIGRFEREYDGFDRAVIKEHSLKFSRQQFKANLALIIEKAIEERMAQSKS